jgi:hypothetical protein
MEPAHYARLVQQLYGLNVFVLMEPFFMFLRKSLDFSTHNVYFQVSVKIAVSYEPGCIDNVPECFNLESLYGV